MSINQWGDPTPPVIWPRKTGRKKYQRKPMVELKFRNRAFTEGEKALLAGMVVGTLLRKGMDVQAKQFMRDANIVIGDAANISPIDKVIKEANKYVYFKLT